MNLLADSEVVASTGGIAAAEALITPALFSQPPPRPPGEEGVVSLESKKSRCFSPLSPGRWGGGEAEHPMTRADELLDNGGADEAGGTGNEDAHVSIIDWHVPAIG